MLGLRPGLPFPREAFLILLDRLDVVPSGDRELPEWVHVEGYVSKRVLAIAGADKQKEAQDAGADFVGGDDVVERPLHVQHHRVERAAREFDPLHHPEQRRAVQALGFRPITDNKKVLLRYDGKEHAQPAIK